MASLGTIVSYDALVQHPAWQIDTFITLGSPLGSPMLVETTIQHDEDGAPRWPGSARHWVNVAAVGDYACAEPRLSTIFGDRVVDRLVDNGPPGPRAAAVHEQPDHGLGAGRSHCPLALNSVARPSGAWDTARPAHGASGVRR